MSSGTGNKAFVSVEIQNSKFTCCEKLPVDLQDGGSVQINSTRSFLEKICALCCCLRHVRMSNNSNNVEEQQRPEDGEIYCQTQN